MKLKSFLLVAIGLVFIQCDDKIKFVSKEVLIKGTTNKMTISVPESCSKFSQGVNISMDALVKYAGQEPSLKASFDMANIISEFSERINAITAAQCKIIQTSVILDPDISDQVFYNELVKNYVEYQKIRDLSNKQNLSDTDKELVARAITDVYKSIYTTKLEELPNYINDMQLTLHGDVGGVIKVYVNQTLICTTSIDNSGIAKCVIGKKYLIPQPDKENNIKIVYSSIGYTDQVKEYSLGELILLNKSRNKLIFDHLEESKL